jgi:suppressor for copper-sensitivity B
MDYQTSIFTLALLGLISGIILNFMPCVLPLIGIKIASFSRLQNKKDVKLSAFSISFGILAFCSLASFIFIFFQNLYWGFQLQFPSFIAVLILIFSAFFLVIIGKININPPIFVRSFNSVILEGFIHGFLIVVFSLSCVAPVIASTVSVAFSSGKPYFIFVCLFFMGVGLSLPYILAGIFGLKFKGNSALVKITKFVSFASVIATICYLVFVLSAQVGTLKTFLIVFVSAICILLLYKFKNLYLFLAGVVIVSTIPFINLTKDVPKDGIAKSVPFSTYRLEEYLNAGHTVIVEIGATWCVTCQINDKAVINTSEFTKFLKDENIVFMKGDLTVKNTQIENFMKSFGVFGVPFYAVFSADNKKGELLPIFFTLETLTKKVQHFKQQYGNEGRE